MIEGKYILLFDGECNLCNGFVQFIIRRDPMDRFRFASLQSKSAERLLSEVQRKKLQGLDTVVLIDNNKVFTESSAALRVLKRLNKAWPLLYVFILVPPFIRNAVYQWVAKYRYKWFGKNASCWVMRKEWKDKFLS